MTLDAQFLAAHAADDKATLVDLYTQAADQADTLDAACFYLTHAYVFALEINAPTTADLFARLRAHGRA